MSNLIVQEELRTEPWSQTGSLVGSGTLSSVLSDADLDFTVESKEITVEGKVIHNYRANTIKDTGEVLGVVSSSYQIVQNADAFAFTDELIKEKEIKFIKGGAFRNRKATWLLAEFNHKVDILGDEIKPYILFSNSHDGSSPVRVAVTPVRIVCANALTFAIKKAERVWRIQHTKNLESNLKTVATFFNNTNSYLESLQETAENLQQIKLTESSLIQAVSNLFPDTKWTQTKGANKNLNEKREAIIQLMDRPDLKKFGVSGWNFLNAVSDYETHRSPKRVSESFNETRLERIASGNRNIMDEAIKILEAA